MTIDPRLTLTGWICSVSIKLVLCLFTRRNAYPLQSFECEGREAIKKARYSRFAFDLSATETGLPGS